MSRHQEPRRTPLYDTHLELDAKMVDFHGFAMPVQYSSIQQEHRSVRSSAGLFDISHMGEIEVWGEEAFDFVQKMVTNDVSTLKTFQVQYTGLCYEHGGLVDDLTLYRFPDHFLLVVNASNIEKDAAWSYPDPKAEVISELTGLKLLTPGGHNQLLRMHRLLQEAMQKSSEDISNERFDLVGDIAEERAEKLREDWIEKQARWELDSQIALLELFHDIDQNLRCLYLANSLSEPLFHLARFLEARLILLKI